MVQQSKGDEPLSTLGEALSTEGADTGEEAVSLDVQVQEQLGKVFRAYCDELVHQPIPDKFVVLLAKLEAKQREKK